MEENKIIENETVEETGTQTETVETGSDNVVTENTDMITLTQQELDKRIQSAEDKLRTKYSQRIKALEKQIEDAKPVEKSAEEKDYEQRLAALEARERAQALNEELDAKGIDRGMAKFLSANVNVDDLAAAIDTLVANRNRKNSYVPTGHLAVETMTKEEFRNLDMDQKERLYRESPELYKTLAR